MNIVQFPGLGGLELQISRVAFLVFGISIYWYGIIIAFGFLLAVLLAVRESKKFGIEPDNILDLVLYAAPVAIVTARLYYVIFTWELFKDNPIDIVNTRKGGLAIYGAVIGALLVAYIYASKKKIGFFNLADFCVPFLILAQGIGRWGNFVNQEAFGGKTDLPWRMNGDVVNAYLASLNQNLDLSKWGVHPTFLYESLWCIAVFFFLLWFRNRKKLIGEVFFLYFILYGFERFFVEQLRTDSLMIGSDVRVSEYLSAVLVVVFIALFIYRRTRLAKAAEDVPVEPGHSEYGAVLAKLREEEDNEGALPEEPADRAQDDASGLPEVQIEEEADKPGEPSGGDRADTPEGQVGGESADHPENGRDSEEQA
jgi:phosphatidylglycerol:prolipoprotein diacylglycerol transferase